jgi:hypothetical protein
MSDELADQLKAHAAERERRRLIQAEQHEREREREAWVYSMAAYEYEDLVQFMKDEVEDTKSKTGNSPEFTVAGSYIQLGHVALYFQFGQPEVNRRNNQLVLSLGLAPSKHGPLSTLLIAEVHKLEAVEDWEKREILWTGKLGLLKTKDLAKMGLQKLVDYYRRHAPK